MKLLKDHISEYDQIEEINYFERDDSFKNRFIPALEYLKKYPKAVVNEFGNRVQIYEGCGIWGEVKYTTKEFKKSFTLIKKAK